MMEISLCDLIERGEGEQVEFKTASKGVHDDTFETVCSFSNHRGGDILLGVNDHGVVVGVPRDSIAMMIRGIRERCSCMDVFSSAVDVRVEVRELRRRQILRIHVEPNSSRVAYKGIQYIRLGEDDYRRGWNG